MLLAQTGRIWEPLTRSGGAVPGRGGQKQWPCCQNWPSARARGPADPEAPPAASLSWSCTASKPPCQRQAACKTHLIHRIFISIRYIERISSKSWPRSRLRPSTLRACSLAGVWICISLPKTYIGAILSAKQANSLIEQ